MQASPARTSAVAHLASGAGCNGGASGQSTGGRASGGDAALVLGDRCGTARPGLCKAISAPLQSPTGTVRVLSCSDSAVKRQAISRALHYMTWFEYAVIAAIQGGLLAPRRHLLERFVSLHRKNVTNNKRTHCMHVVFGQEDGVPSPTEDWL